MERSEPQDDRCPVFGVESGGPVIGLGILIMLFGIVPSVVIPGVFPLPIAVLFTFFGIFLIWVGLTR